ncbi:hypothetical protein BRCON_1953 [Candidatus Sumerlaea chitinivorans]|uniref:Uncharacterized protein n=1 Tax=Sumerlaea chitinivorans TaxID=2250252 RepID=A0A2Z4Y6A1_SUMC1|nr:hypothetical protein BRCON_1953 [Candidatus Sumerlaea chitinivorans]
MRLAHHSPLKRPRDNGAVLEELRVLRPPEAMDCYVLTKNDWCIS